MMDLIAKLGTTTVFTFDSMKAAIRAIRRPSDWLSPFANILMGGLPLALLAGLAIGVVIWVHTRSVLDRTGTGAAELLPTFLAAAVVLELAPLGAGLILASRTAAALGAELASMKVTEQIDALHILGVSSLNRIVGPRVLAACLSGPLLFLTISSVAILGGYIAESVIGTGSWLRYERAALAGVRLADAIASILKSLIFGGLVGLVGCAAGLQAKNGSESVGEATTQSVVRSMLAVILADVLLVVTLQLALNR
jgi:phospholipid/cholesterol/gamma-HCH transport system permease protein